MMGIHSTLYHHNHHHSKRQWGNFLRRKSVLCACLLHKTRKYLEEKIKTFSLSGILSCECLFCHTNLDALSEVSYTIFIITKIKDDLLRTRDKNCKFPIFLNTKKNQLHIFSLQEKCLIFLFQRALMTMHMQI